MKLRKPFMDSSSLNTDSACALTLDQISSRSACFMAAYSSLDSWGCSGWGCGSCFFPIKLDKSIGHYLPFCFFFLLFGMAGVGCWRSCCLDFFCFLLRLPSCRISCSCFFTEGFCSGSLWLVKSGEELLLGEEGADGLFSLPPGFLLPARSKICGGILLGWGRY